MKVHQSGIDQRHLPQTPTAPATDELAPQILPAHSTGHITENLASTTGNYGGGTSRPPPQPPQRISMLIQKNHKGTFENVIVSPEYLEKIMVLDTPPQTPANSVDKMDNVLHNTPTTAVVGNPGKHRIITQTSNCGSTSTGLDDGYGSSTSTPHTIPGRTQNVFNSVKEYQTNPAQISNLITNCSANIQKKNLQVQIDAHKSDQTTTTAVLKPLPDATLYHHTNTSIDSLGNFAIDDIESVKKHHHLTGRPLITNLDNISQIVSSTSKSNIKDQDDVGDDRETWGTNADFLLSIIGFAVDLANVWRFPYLCYKNGGGAFLIPYTLMLVFGAVPLFYMELILGQFNRQGPISVWRICPLFKGVGFCAVMVAFYVSFYYNVIIGWSLYFLVSSTQSELPWLHCNNTWNTNSCWDSNSMNKTTHPIAGVPELAVHMNKFTPASEFFHRAVLEMQWSDGLHEMGYPKWQLVLCVMCVYCMLYFSLFKGVKSSGKVVWATATMPYVVLSILLIRGLMLPGAMTGIKYYLKPELSRLADTQVWVDAAVQIFYSVGAGFGVHLSYASYNRFHNNCYRDCIVTTIVNCFTSFFSGFVIFTYLGFMSHKQGVHISNVATEGPGLVFQVYPEAVATLPGSNFWSMLFFFMLIMLGLDSAMGGMECVITGLMDEFHGFFGKKKYAREIFTACAAFVSFCVACINVTPGGIYMFHLFDTYSAGISLLCSALFEAVAVSWFYGLEKFSNDVELMIGSRPGLYWRICWKFISPSFIIGVVVFGLIYHQKLSYNDYHYPDWAEMVGWGLALSSILMIPIVAIIQMIKTPGTFKERLAYNITPIDEHEQLKETNCQAVSRFKLRHWLYV